MVDVPESFREKERVSLETYRRGTRRKLDRQLRRRKRAAVFGPVQYPMVTVRTEHLMKNLVSSFVRNESGAKPSAP